MHIYNLQYTYVETAGFKQICTMYQIVCICVHRVCAWISEIVQSKVPWNPLFFVVHLKLSLTVVKIKCVQQLWSSYFRIKTDALKKNPLYLHTEWQLVSWAKLFTVRAKEGEKVTEPTQDWKLL